jgi:hypothetical protein
MQELYLQRIVFDATQSYLEIFTQTFIPSTVWESVMEFSI